MFSIRYGILVFGLCVTAQGWADVCAKWSHPQSVGQLDGRFLSEASGMAISRQFLDRIYHHNDSGNSTGLFITDIEGGATQKIAIEGFHAFDAEDIGQGPCPQSIGHCLYLADIGDNFGIRRSIEIIVIQEQERYGATLSPVARIALNYPDGAHNAEALAVHPNGDIFIATKEKDSSGASPTRIYRLLARDAARAANRVQTLTKVGTIDVPLLAQARDKKQVVTAMDIAADGHKFILLTYSGAIEFSVDLSRDAIKPTHEMSSGIDYHMIPLKVLQQQEALSYYPDGMSFLYETEVAKQGGSQEIVRVQCLD